MSFIKRIKEFGPAALVTAAFIGPGTITTCSIAGAGYGYTLLWALLFSVLATIVLQEMSARLGIIGKSGLGEGIRNSTISLPARMVAIVLIISAVGIGNAAYETGNILGGSMGLEAITGFNSVSAGNITFSIWPLVIGSLAFVLLFSGNYRTIEIFLIGLVIIMSVTFITTAIIVKPEMKMVMKGMFVPSAPSGSILTIVALIGTTVVPYNLFLHASAAKAKWQTRGDLKIARADSVLSIGVGGLISMAIIVTASSAFFGSGTSIANAGDLAGQLEPLMGEWSKYMLSAGLLAAGVSSAVTAPLAGAYAISGILGNKGGTKGLLFRIIWITILLTGVILASLKLNPIKVITFAQFANGLLLPIIAGYLLWIMNNRSILGDNVNKPAENIAGGIVLLITFLLGMKSIVAAVGLI